jgi:hypothetical protein
MSVLGRIHLFPPDTAPAPRPAAVPAAAEAAELGDDELEAVVGGLERVYVPDPAAY